MTTAVLDATAPAIDTASAPRVRWNPLTRIAFRFCFLYFGLYVVTTQMLGGMIVIPGAWSMPELETLPPLKTLITWTAAHVFGVTTPLVITGSGSCDKTFDWVAAFCLLVISAIASASWSIVDRRRDNYVTMHKWFRLFLRFATGTTMLSYGMIKAIPLQMPAPPLTRLLEPFGNFSPMGVLWYSIGASPGYERFAGAMELTAAVLLFIPRTALLGALVLLADSVQIFTLNMTYDVPVKLFSFHLILMALVLLAPESRRLLNVLILDRTAAPSSQPPLVRSVRAQRILLAAQLVFAAYVIVVFVMSSRQSWTSYGGGAPKPALYGIWDVTKLSIDGVERAPLVTDYDRWRRLVIQTPTFVSFQRMDQTFLSYPAKTDLGQGTIALSKPADPSWKSQFTFQQPDPDHLTIDGTLDGRRIRMNLQRFDHAKMLLLTRGFNWIQEYPFNR
jgi:hypothetical protein